MNLVVDHMISSFNYWNHLNPKTNIFLENREKINILYQKSK